MCSRSYVVILLLFQTIALSQAQNEDATLPRLTCANVRCMTGTYCRTVVTCSTCQPTPRCVPTDNIKEDTDTLCKNGNYTEAILLENPNNSSSYSLLQCGVNDDTQKCPWGSDCIQGQTGNGACCQVHIDPSQPTEKPGVCPSKGEMGVCGPVCVTDDDCTGSEKCCLSSCGSTCMAAVDDTPPRLTCANVRCMTGTYCRTVVTCSTCQPTPRCVPTDNIQEDTDTLCQTANYTEAILLENANNSSSYSLLKCGVNDDTQKCPWGSDCIQDQTGNGSCCQGQINPSQPTEKPGVCPSGDIFICGGVMCQNDSDCPGVQKCCSSCGQMCTNPLCGNSVCASGETCVDKQRPCPQDSMCIQALTPTCVPDGCVKCAYNEDCNKTDAGYDCFPYQQLDQCGGCPDGKVCIDTLIRCVMAPCPESYQCVVPNECGGCLSGQVCKSTGTTCDPEPCPEAYQCVAELDHPGTCPEFEPENMGLCGPVCTADDNCTNFEKCCPSACGGNTCTVTVYDPCRGFGCQNGGYCTAPADAPYCICPTGFNGTYCEETVEVTPSSITCSNIRCASGTYCRAVVSCSTCQPTYRCVPADNVHEDTDILCQDGNYTEAILLENPNNSSSYSLLQCEVNDTQKCPWGSDCIQSQRGNGSCCQRRTEVSPQTEKPGVCPSGDISICGGVMCQNDSDCPGVQKCCSRCGKMCTNPLCGHSVCAMGETCVDKQRPCPQDFMCTQALTPTCVSDGCVKCAYNEDCNKTDVGYECVPYQQLDQCGGCPDGKVCIDTLIRCVMAPCPESYQCVVPNECGGCLSGQVCKSTVTTCDQQPCPEAYQCVAELDHLGTCPEFEPGNMGICGPVCTADDNCTNFEKCCPSACGGNACTFTVYDPCRGFGCQNGGYCTAPADAPYCVCPSGFNGTYCEETVAVTPPSITCANIRCASGTHCRTVVSCSTCQPTYRCIPADNVHEDTDILCHNENYTEAILLESLNNSSSYSLLQCRVNDDTQKCPWGSDCIQGQRGNGSCCQRRTEVSPQTEKPGVCPSGDFSICGGLMCQNDSDCPGVQKCCSRCGKMCTNPLCGNSVCDSGETCVDKQPPCPPDSMCTQALTPTCVPDGCVKCAYNEDCNKTDAGYECVPYQQLDQCGGCPDGKVCIDTLIRCVMAPCPESYQCVVPNECGGCLSGQICKSTGTSCDQEPCPEAYQCVAELDHTGTCPVSEPGGMGICGPVCSFDNNCASSEKCCPSACGGRTCTTAVPVTPPSITCDNIRCAAGTFCRTVVSCSTCQPTYRCVSADNVQKDTDTLCQNLNYTEAILLENPNNSSSYSLLPCGVNADTQKCPSGSDCIQDQAGNGSCCQVYTNPSPPTEKPGVCPSGDISICGGVLCQNDSNCPGVQKCCSACGKMCTNPLCGNSVCSLGETCVDKQRPCPQDSMCIQALTPTCVPDGCVKCAYNEDCNKTDDGYECIPYKQLDQCGGCPDGKVCIDTLIRCVMAPCPESYQCVVPNECGGCLSGQVCKSIGTTCDQEPCPEAYQCVAELDHPGTCPVSEPGGMGICGPVCSVDNNCASSEKCCPSACGGRTCTTAVSVTPPSITCANMRCADGMHCRTVVSCSTCQPTYRCVPADNIQKDTDTLCRNKNYTEAILLENPNNSSSYSLLQCGTGAATQKCPLGSDCIQGQAGSGSCCQGHIDPSPAAEKPGVCPSGDVSVCGGVMCQNDSDCPGVQKCCSECGKMCTNPLCGNSVCALGETCVDKQRQCPPDSMCIQALTPTCVPDGCVKCAYNEDCNKTDAGYKCLPYQSVDQCGGCTDGKVCINTGIVCIKAPCPTFQCVTPNECGGCPNGQMCKNTGIKCDQEPCPPSYQCVLADECGGCPIGQVCKDTSVMCNTTECQSFKCLPENENSCPLRCPANYACEIKQKVCVPVGRFMCMSIEVPTCVPIKPQFGSCPRVTWRLPPQSLYCKMEQLFFSCKDDSDCHGTRTRCCSSVCGSKKCTYVSRQTRSEYTMD